MDSLLDKFGKIIIASRNSGIRSFLKYKNENYLPKNPSDEEKSILRILSELTAEQKNDLLNVLKYTIDLSFFKLLSYLEEGVNDITFELTIKNKDGSLHLIADEEDLEIRSKYWLWLTEDEG